MKLFKKPEPLLPMTCRVVMPDMRFGDISLFWKYIHRKARKVSIAKSDLVNPEHEIPNNFLEWQKTR